MKTYKLLLTLGLITTTTAVARLNITAALFYFGIMVVGTALYQISEAKEIK